MADKTWDLRRLRKTRDYWQSSVLLTAAHLDLFGWIGRRKIDSHGAAARFGGSAAGWEIFFDALCAMGLMHKRGDRYASTRFAARYLTRDGRALLLPDYDAWNTWSELAVVLTTGERPRTQQPFASDRAKAGRLLEGLHLHARQIAPHVIRQLNLKGSRTFLDIGGGLGTFAQAFCRRYPRLLGTLVEHPNVVPLARRAVRESGLAKRIRVIGLDFSRQRLPQGFDVAFVSNVLHAHGAGENVSLLRRIYRSLNAGGQLILRDVFMRRDRSVPAWGALFSVSLLLHTPRGRCYSLSEIHGWLSQVGFSAIRGPVRSSPLPFDPDSIVVASKARAK